MALLVNANRYNQDQHVELYLGRLDGSGIFEATSLGEIDTREIFRIGNALTSSADRLTTSDVAYGADQHLDSRAVPVDYRVVAVGADVRSIRRLAAVVL